MRRINKKSIMIVIIVVLLLLLTATIGLYYLINNHKEPVNDLVYEEFDQIGGKIDNNTYYIFGAKKDISFEIIKENDFSYELVDEDNNKVDNPEIDNDILTIKAPEENYKEGKTYHLKITNGKFKDEKYKDIKEIIFSIARSSKQSSSIKNNLIKVNNNSISIVDNTININGDYQENNIIAAYDNNNLIGVYKISKKGDNNTYEYIVPSMDEIFDDIDYYGKERINLDSYQNNKDFNLFLNSLIHTVYAKEDVTINKPIWNKKDGTLEVEILVNTSNKKEFLVNHDTKVSLTLILSIDLYRDITLDNYDFILVINYNIRTNNNLNYINTNFNNLYDAVKTKETIENYDTKWLEDSYSNLETDKKEINKIFTNVFAETKIPGLYLTLDTGVLMDINNKGFINSSLRGNNTLIAGINKQNGIYSDYTFDNNTDINFLGDNDNTIAGIINAKLNFINIFNLDTKMTGGLYTNGKTKLDINKDDEKQTKINIDIDGDSGFFGKYLITATNVEEKTIFNDKLSLTKYNKKIKISSKQKGEKEEDKKEEITYKYSAEKVRELLQNGYDALDELTAWNEPIGTFTVHGNYQKTIDVDNNTFSGTWNFDSTVSYTCNYNYVTEAMSCDNFSEAQDYVKGTCDDMYNDYLAFMETGETDNEDAKEWETLYGNIEACYYEAIPRSEPTDFKEDIQNILNQVELTFEDLGVLKN